MLLLLAIGLKRPAIGDCTSGEFRNVNVGSF